MKKRDWLPLILYRKRITGGIGTVLATAAIIMILTLVPSNDWVVAVWISLVTVASGLIAWTVLNGRQSMVMATGTGVFLTVTAVLGFQLLPTIVLLLIILGVLQLVS